MAVVILGMGKSGCSLANYLLNKGEELYTCDDAPEKALSRPDVKLLLQAGVKMTNTLPDVPLDYALLSPGIPRNHHLCLELERRQVPLIGEVEFAARRISNPVIGVSGTNGKTSVTLQIVHTLNNCGIEARAMGNVGTPLTDLLCDKFKGIIVLELSSYQLETLESRILDAAVLLNITQDHLDRYPSMTAYASAKWRLGNVLKDQSPFYVSWDILERFPSRHPVLTFGIDPQVACHLEFRSGAFYRNGTYEGVLDSNLARYELHNLLAVYAICSHYGISLQQVLESYRSFKRPPHRLQYVATVNGVEFYDDSKGTTPEAVLAAIEALGNKKILLIAGGDAKGATFHCWRTPFANHVKGIYLIGTSAQQIALELKGITSLTFCKNLEEAVTTAYSAAISGDVVLLSPGCASLDMFTSYIERGELFQRIVRKDL